MTEAKALTLGYYPVKKLPNGEWLGVKQMMFTCGLFIFSEDCWRTRYCYEHALDAISALILWDGEGDPPGPWIVQKPEDRYRRGVNKR